MTWVKVPTAATAVACTACVAAAMALPVADTAADRLAKAVTANMHLSALDITSWDALSALPAYEALLSGDPTQLFALGSLDGVPALAQFLATGDLSAFTPAADGTGGYAALSGLQSYAAFLQSGDPQDLAGIDAFSGIPAILALDPSGIAATDAIPHYQAFLTTGDTSVTGLGGVDAFSALPAFTLVPTQGIAAFVPSAASSNPGYAALSGLNSYATGDLSGIDAFSALTPPVTMASQQAVVQEKSQVQQSSVAGNTDDPTPAATTTGPIKKIIEKVREDVGNLGKFTPKGNGTILFPTGGGGAATDTNDAWHKVLHSVGLGGAGEKDQTGGDTGTG